MRPEERRQYPRLELRTEIWLGQDGIFTHTSETLGDLSEGGAFIRTAQRYPVGSILTLRFKLPGAQAFITSTIIVRNTRNETGLGIEFLDLTSEDRQLIRSCIGEYLSSNS